MLATLGRTDNVEICPEPVDIKAIYTDDARRCKIREQLQIPERGFVWVMSGFFHLRENPGLLLELAQRLHQTHPDAHFLWLGASTGCGAAEYLINRTRELGLHHKLHWLAARTDDYYDYLNAADGFVLTSLEDPCPLVSIEALALGKPMVASNCGGIREILTDNIGILVEHCYSPAMAEAMIRVMDGAFAFDPKAARLRAADFEAERITREWERLLEKHLPQVPSRRERSSKCRRHSAKLAYLLTGTIDPKKTPFVQRNDPKLREQDYLKALRVLLQAVKEPVVFCENSGSNLSRIQALLARKSKAEYDIVRSETSEAVQNRGKGYGEFLLLEQALKESALLGQVDYVVKITGRYRIRNLAALLAPLEAGNDVFAMCAMHWERSWADSGFVVFRPAFFFDYWCRCKEKIDDIAGYYMEHALHDALLAARADGRRCATFLEAPIIAGYSGTVNRKL